MTSRATPKAVSLGRDRNSPRMLRQCGIRMPSLRHAASSVLPGSSPGMGGRGRDTRAGCHDMSCFVMFRMRTAHRSLPVRAYRRGFGQGPGTFRCGSPAVRLRHGFSLHDPFSFPFPRRRLSLLAGPFAARIACGRGRASCAGAVRAPDCPRVRGRRRADVSRLFLGVFFRAGANRKTKRPRADAVSLLPPHIATGNSENNPFS